MNWTDKDNGKKPIGGNPRKGCFGIFAGLIIGGALTLGAVAGANAQSTEITGTLKFEVSGGKNVTFSDKEKFVTISTNTDSESVIPVGMYHFEVTTETGYAVKDAYCSDAEGVVMSEDFYPSDDLTVLLLQGRETTCTVNVVKQASLHLIISADDLYPLDYVTLDSSSGLFKHHLNDETDVLVPSGLFSFELVYLPNGYNVGQLDCFNLQSPGVQSAQVQGWTLNLGEWETLVCTLKLIPPTRIYLPLISG